MPIHPKTIYSKTPKGVLEIKNRTAKLEKVANQVLVAIDGKSTVADLRKKADIEPKAFDETLEKLTTDGFVRVFFTPPEVQQAAAQAAAVASAEDAFDFTTPEAMTKLNTEQEARAKAEAAAKARALAAARAAAEAKVKQEAEARARAAADAKVKAEAEAKARAEAAAKAAAEARIKAEAEAKAAANAKAKAEAEARVKAAMEAKVRADAEAKARAEAEARAKIDAQARAESEAKAKVEAESRAKAETEARAVADAETKAKTAVEAQMKALQEALAQAEQRAKAEAEQRSRMEAEIKAHAEAEAKARVEAEARAKAAEEAVAQALARAEEAAKAKAEAEKRAAQQAASGGGGGIDPESQARLDAAMKALEEAKAKAKADAEAREAAERKAQQEAEARKREDEARHAREEQARKEREEAEARSKAQLREMQEQADRARIEAEVKAGIERKAREEAEARIDAERKARVEAEAKARAEVERQIAIAHKMREEAEKKAQAEIAARVASEKKAREEAERQIAAAHKAREEAEAKTREAMSSGNAQKLQEARAEAEFIAKRAEAEVAKAQAQAEAEKAARAQAEERAKAEAVARVMQEQNLRARSEDDIKARVQQEIKAREQAEMEADARYRKEAAERAKASAEERKKREEESRSAGAVMQQQVKQPANIARSIGILVVVLIAAAVAIVEYVPLNNYVPGAQKIMSDRLGVPVTIGGLRYSLLQTQLTLERVTIGKLQETKIGTIVVKSGPMGLLGENKSFDEVEITAINADQDALALVPGWAAPATGEQPLRVKRIKLRGAKVSVKALDLDTFEGDILLGPDGAMQRAVFNDGKLKVDLTAKDKAVRVALEARGWKPPLGPAIEFDDLTLEAVVDGQQATISSFEGKLGFAPVKGSARASWRGGAISVEGDFNLSNGDLGKLLPVFARDFTATGHLTTNAKFALQATALENLFAEPKVEATFNIERGVLNNLDLVRAVQNPSRDGTRGGKTVFNTLTGSLQVAGKHYSYRQLQISSGPLNATGAFDVNSAGDLSGRINAEVGSKTIVIAKGTLTVSGNMRTPVLKP